MRPEERNLGCLWDMRKASREALAFLAGKTRTDLDRDRLLQLAIEKEIEIIGEAARRVTDDFKTSHPNIPWRSIIAQRNILIHEYNDIDLDVVWNDTLMHLDDLIREIDGVLSEAEPK